MPSPTETLAALVAAALGAVVGAKVLRGGALPEAIPAAGLINVVETEPEETGELLGGEREFVLVLDVELAALGSDDGARAGVLDTLARNAASSILASPTLRAAVDHLRVHPLRDRQDLAQPGAAAIRTATLPVELHYRTGPNPMESF